MKMYINSRLEEFKINDMLNMELWTGSSISITENIIISVLVYNMIKNIGSLWSKKVLKYIVSMINGLLIVSLSWVGRKLIFIIMGLFMLILTWNILGLTRSSSTITGDILNNLIISLSVWINLIVLGIYYYGSRIYKHFSRSNIRILILPLLVVIELISFTSRVISLTVRLGANMIGGLVMLKLIGSLVLLLWSTQSIIENGNILILIQLMVAIYILEIAVCVIKSYVYSLLSSLYLKDMIKLSH